MKVSIPAPALAVISANNLEASQPARGSIPGNNWPERANSRTLALMFLRSEDRHAYGGISPIGSMVPFRAKIPLVEPGDFSR